MELALEDSIVILLIEKFRPDGFALATKLYSRLGRGGTGVMGT